MAISRVTFGRTVIYSDVAEINADNVIDVLTKAMQVHDQNRADIDYLYNYRLGDQPILKRIKEVRPEINNKIVENRADEIVQFKTGYLMGEPIQYVSRSEDQAVCDAVTTLNDFMLAEDKATDDTDMAEWFYTCGTSFRMVLPDATADEEDEAPFEVYVLDPRTAFVIYQNSLRRQPLAGVTYVDRKDAEGKSYRVYSVYTDNMYYEIRDLGQKEISMEVPQYLGIPIIEYPLNQARLGAFETVLTMLDAINLTASNRVDGVEQFIQALLLFHNVDISAEDFRELREKGAIKFKDIDSNLKADIDYLLAQLDQGQTQVLVDHMYNTVLTLCGMPNRNGGSSTSDTGTAVIYRDGHAAAEGRAKKDEMIFKKSEKQFLKLVLRICRDLIGLDLKLSDVEIRFTRRNYENTAEKVNALVTMLNCDKIDPQLAFAHCGMFSDPNIAYQMSKKYREEQEKKQQEQMKMQMALKSQDPGGSKDSKDPKNQGGNKE